MSNVPPSSQGPSPPCSLLTFMVVFPVEGQGVALRVLLPLLLSQVGVGVVVAEPRPVLIPFPTDWRAERAGTAGQPSQPTPSLPWPPRSHLPPPLPEACASPNQGQVPGRGGGVAGEDRSVGPTLSLSPSSEGLTITDIRLVSVLQGSGVLAFSETPNAICLGEESEGRGQEREESECPSSGPESQTAAPQLLGCGP